MDLRRKQEPWRRAGRTTCPVPLHMLMFEYMRIRNHRALQPTSGGWKAWEGRTGHGAGQGAYVDEYTYSNAAHNVRRAMDLRRKHEPWRRAGRWTRKDNQPQEGEDPQPQDTQPQVGKTLNPRTPNARKAMGLRRKQEPWRRAGRAKCVYVRKYMYP